MTAVVGTPPRPSLLRRIARLAPYILLAPGLLWLLYFFIWPLTQMALMSVSSGTLDSGFHVTGTLKSFSDALTKFGTQWGNSLLYGGTSTVLGFLVWFSAASTLPFKGRRDTN